MKTSGLVFYPLNVLTMNVIHDLNNHIIAMVQSLMAHLPTNYYESETRSVLYDHCMETIKKLRNIHNEITKFMGNIARKAVSGLLCRTKGEFYLRLHISTGSYFAELPEQKDILCVKHSNIAYEPCPRFH